MPKPLEGVQGSGMHTHLSLFEGDENAFHDPGDPYKAVQGRQGLHRRAPAPRPRDHRDHQPDGELLQAAGPGFEAPVYVSWARNNRSALVRVPTAKKGKARATRIEYRAPTRLQPLPGVLGDPRRRAGGHRGGLRAAARGGGQHLRAHRARRPPSGIERSPQSLSEALDDMERSELVAEALGEHVFEWFLRNKRPEWDRYKPQVTRFELENYLPIL